MADYVDEILYQSSEVEGKTQEHSIPRDLYIPPEALIVVLQQFEGPLDLLLYMIRKQNIDILNIPIADITDQYMAYINVMSNLRFELAGDYLVMAATLAEIKSRLLLPRQLVHEDEEEDPRADLVRRLLEYEIFRQAAVNLNDLPHLGRDVHALKIVFDEGATTAPPPETDLSTLTASIIDVLERMQQSAKFEISAEALSVKDRMSSIIDILSSQSGYIPFSQLFDSSEAVEGFVVTFVALLELVKLGVTVVLQHETHGPLFVAKRDSTV